MIYKHKYLSELFLNGKIIHRINKQSSLLLLICDKFTFMNQFLIKSLRLKKISFQIHSCSQPELMSYHLPAIAFKNYFLTQENLIQFICDLLLQNQSFTHFTQRKHLVKDQYRKWFLLIKQENQALVSYSSLKIIGVQSQQDYYNHMFSQYFSIASWIKGDILQRKYDNYKKNQVNLQNLFIYDLISSVLKLCQKTKLQYVLRSSFQNIMEWREQFKAKIFNQIRQSDNEQYDQIQIITQPIHEQVNNHAKVQLNHKKFAIILTVMAGLYIKFVS